MSADLTLVAVVGVAVVASWFGTLAALPRLLKWRLAVAAIVGAVFSYLDPSFGEEDPE